MGAAPALAGGMCLDCTTFGLLTTSKLKKAALYIHSPILNVTMVFFCLKIHRPLRHTVLCPQVYGVAAVGGGSTASHPVMYPKVVDPCTRLNI